MTVDHKFYNAKHIRYRVNLLDQAEADNKAAAKESAEQEALVGKPENIGGTHFKLRSKIPSTTVGELEESHRGDAGYHSLCSKLSKFLTTSFNSDVPETSGREITVNANDLVCLFHFYC